MERTKTLAKAIKRIGLLSGVALIAVSASAIPGTTALAAAPAANQQIAEGQQPNSPPQWQQQKPDKNHQGGQGQSQKQGGQQNGQSQFGQQQQWNQKNGQPRYQQGGQPQYGQQSNQQNGQPRYQQGGQGQNQQWSQQGNQQQWKQPSQTHRFNWASYEPGHRPPQWQQYRQSFNPREYEWNRYAERRYHWEPYRPPYGWYYQRWSYGQYLPTVFWVRQYWLVSYVNFGLIDPPYGYVWVRYGNDALLVDVETGQILSVEYGVFYS